jgi:hypothetical protein
MGEVETQGARVVEARLAVRVGDDLDRRRVAVEAFGQQQPKQPTAGDEAFSMDSAMESAGPSHLGFREQMLEPSVRVEIRSHDGDIAIEEDPDAPHDGAAVSRSRAVRMARSMIGATCRTRGSERRPRRWPGSE